MSKRKIENTEMDQQARIAALSDKYYAALKKEGATIKELHKILYRIRSMAAENSKL